MLRTAMELACTETNMTDMKATRTQQTVSFIFQFSPLVLKLDYEIWNFRLKYFSMEIIRTWTFLSENVERVQSGMSQQLY